ncbi:hypothetical protein QQ045_006890 [Rhodiola kirilowii]
MSCNGQFLFMLAAILILDIFQEVNGIGVNYGLLGNNLPDPSRSIAVLKSRGVYKIRLFTPDQRVLNALRGSGVEVYIGTLNQDLPALAGNPGFAVNWVRNNVSPYATNVRISGVVVGNEVESGPLGGHLVAAMYNLDTALRAAGIRAPVTTAVSYGMMRVSYPPSHGSFNPSAAGVMGGVARFLGARGYPLLANIYPYFAYRSDPSHINPAYALLKNDGSTVVTDGNLKYYNLLDAMVDALYSALERVGGGNVRVIVSETGWPSAAGAFASIDYARQYNNNLARMVKSGRGTPKRPRTRLEAYIFAMFNENLKPGGIEQHWGLYYPNLQEVYHFIRPEREEQGVNGAGVFFKRGSIGVNYGLLGNNLPDQSGTIAELKSRGINRIRIFTPNHEVLEALRGSGIGVYIGTLNEDLPSLADNPSFATNWVRNNILPYKNYVMILGVTAGNEVELGPYGVDLVNAMHNLDTALRAAGFRIPVTTVVSYGMMGVSYPPSNGSFSQSALEVMSGVARFLGSKGYPLLANIYPYFSAYQSAADDIKLDYALLKNDGSTVVTDGKLKYTNLLDAMVDALYSALERVGARNVKVIISETGWPNAAGPYATIDNARQYNNNLVRMVKSGRGTPKRPWTRLEAYIFAMYNENLKSPGIEQHWGLYYPNLQEVYHVNL